MKGLIVIDNIPDNCKSCPIVRIKWNRKANIEVCECPLKEYEYIGYEDKKPSWCPLKPLSKNMEGLFELVRQQEQGEDIIGYKDEQNDKEWNRLLSKVQEKQNDYSEMANKKNRKESEIRCDN